MSTNTPALSNSTPIGVGPFAQMPAATKVKAGVGVIALGAVAVSAWLWSQQPDWKILYNNLPDREGGAVIAQLVQMNVPYRYTEGGGAIMVPAGMVHDARLRLAAQGLPRSDTNGYELMEKQRFGMTQFQERLNFQRGLEGELVRSIQSLAAVRQARVHLAIPVQNGFLREQQKPSASVVLTLYPGRVLERSQVQGILRLVASSVPDMSPKQVSIVDQHGKLLSDLDADGGAMNSAQINYRNQIESNLSRRINDLLEPIVGNGNIRAQVAADIDFTQSEATAETYAPNQNPANAAIRSQQMMTARDGSGALDQPGGVPGALSNQPPGAVTASINGSAQTTAAAGSAASGANGAAGSSRQESVTNYEIDRTVRVTRNQTGSIRRLSVAVLLNEKQSVNDEGKSVSTPLTAMELQSIEALVKQAVGFSAERGDSVQVVNAAFTRAPATEEAEVPLWKDPETVSLAKDLGKQFGFVVLALIILFMFIRPALQAMKKSAESSGKKLNATVDDPLSLPDAAGATDGSQVQRIETVNPDQGMGMTIAQHNALQLARTDPTAVATVVRHWVNGTTPDKAS